MHASLHGLIANRTVLFFRQTSHEQQQQQQQELHKFIPYILHPLPSIHKHSYIHTIKLSIWSSYLSRLHTRKQLATIMKQQQWPKTAHMKAQTISTISTLSNELKVDANILTPNCFVYAYTYTPISRPRDRLEFGSEEMREQVLSG